MMHSTLFFIQFTSFFIIVFASHLINAFLIQTALIGKSALLPCNIRSNITNDTTELVLWYRDTWESPIYKMDARGHSTKHNMHVLYKNRIIFESDSYPAYLKIHKVREDDDGIYRCRVDFRKQRTVNMKIKLVVVVLPSKPVVTNLNGEKLYGTVGPYNEGEDVTFVCSVENGKPAPTVSWWLDDQLMDNTSEEIKNGIAKNTFIYKNIPRTFNLKKLRCEASNMNDSAIKSDEITPTLNFKPKYVSITSGKESLSAGIEAKLICKSSGSRPPADITWWKGSERMRNTKQKIVTSSELSVNDSNTTTISELKFVPETGDDNKYLSCRASNAAISQSAIEDGWKLVVYYVPKATLQLTTLSQEYIVEGDDVSLECKIEANPYITDVRWTFNSQILLEDEHSGYHIKDSTLYIAKVKASHIGDYVCLANNTQGTGSSNPVKLVIRYKPICSDNNVPEIGASEDEVVKVKCSLDSNPDKVKFHWWTNSTLQPRNITNFRDYGSTSYANYHVKSSEDYGFIFCMGQNSIGMQEVACSFQVIKAGRPDPVENCSIINETQSSVHVECDAGHDGGLRQTFYATIYVYPQRRFHSNLSALDQPVFISSELQPSTNYMFVITARNSKGSSSTVAIIANTKPGELHKASSWFNTEIIMLIAVLVGILLVLGIIICVVFLMLWKRKRTCQKMDFTLKKKEDDSSLEEKSYSEIEVLNPDVVPLNTLESVSGSIYPIYSDVPAPYINDRGKKKFVTLKQNGDNRSTDRNIYGGEAEVRYAELSIAKCPDASRQIRSLNEDRTEYAVIDFNRRGVKQISSRSNSLSDHTNEDTLSKDVPNVISDSAAFQATNWANTSSTSPQPRLESSV